MVMAKLSPTILGQYELVVGLEVHCQLLTKSKIFSADPTSFGDAPNTNISVITLAHPGTLPKFNRQAAELAIRIGLACGCEISRYNVFDRKNYFYPDLPKGFQTTQDKTPICLGGQVAVRFKHPETKQLVAGLVQLNRIHLEEDAGKSIHLEGSPETLIDLNRAGTALIEIVTDPVIHYPEEAGAYLAEVRRLVRFLGVCDGNMEEGSMRCDANVSVRRRGQTQLGRKVEVKNMNSIRNVQRAIEHEYARQVTLLESGGQVVSETRLFNADTGLTFAMRTKEELNDYRYFPEPDLPPFVVSEDYLASLQATQPPLPQQLEAKLVDVYGLPEYDAGVLTDDKATALYFEEVVAPWAGGPPARFKAASNWLMGPIRSYLNEQGLDMEALALAPAKLRELIGLVEQGKVSFSTATKELFPALLARPDQPAEALAAELHLLHDSSEDSIAPLISEVLAKYPSEVLAYKKGKKNLLGMFMGEVMKASKGKIDPKKANDLVRVALEA
jgi:aspartyl-tRNA(Asn)/glutamyl-tRNA(Gln) amidotransferase subunit B